MDRLTLSPEMNAEIINILRLSPDDDIHQYAAQLIEEQAAQLAALRGEIAELRARLETGVYSKGTLMDWYINSVDADNTPQWAEEHIDELLRDFCVLPKAESALAELERGTEK